MGFSPHPRLAEQHDAQQRPIQVLVVDDQIHSIWALSLVFARRTDIVIAGEAFSGEEALEKIPLSQPDVVVMDSEMPGMGGPAATREILRRYPEIRVLAYSGHREKEFVSGMLGAGAAGYLLKDSMFEAIVEAVKRVASGKSYLSPGLDEPIVAALQSPSRDEIGSLTAREREVLKLLAEGKSVKEIGADLRISPRTAERHRENIMRKLGARSLADLARIAVRAGICRD